MNWLNKILGVGAAAVLLVACANTVVPKPTRDNMASYDGTNQNSGFVGYLPNGAGEITPHARDRYNGLIAVYSKRFLPPLTPDAGLKTHGENWEIDPEHLVKFMQMNRWRKTGQ